MKRKFFLIFSLFFLAGCTTPQLTGPGVTVIAPPTVVEENNYPAPQIINSYPYPESGSAQQDLVTNVAPTAIPVTPDPTLAMVKGQLLLNDVPVNAAILYLAKVIQNENGNRMVGFDRINDFRTATDEQGNFTFVNLSPGAYGLVLDRILNSYLLLLPGTEETILVNIESNELVDLGTLNYDDLPLSTP